MEKPILFSTEMVRAILDGRKTQTRRVIDRDIVNGLDIDTDGSAYAFIDQATGDSYDPEKICRYQPGDILWVRETWYYESHMEDLTAGEPDLVSGNYSHRYIYKADSPDYPVNVGVGRQGWRPSIHMPREAARLFLKVTDVWVERLQEISNTDIRKEGVADFGCVTHHLNMLTAWDNIYSAKGYCWESNPWVWVIEFERMG